MKKEKTIAYPQKKRISKIILFKIFTIFMERDLFV